MARQDPGPSAAERVFPENEAHDPVCGLFAQRETKTHQADFGAINLLGATLCGQIEFEAVMKNRKYPVEFRSITWQRVVSAEGREKREQEAKAGMKTILKQRKKQQNEHRE